MSKTIIAAAVVLLSLLNVADAGAAAAKSIVNFTLQPLALPGHVVKVNGTSMKPNATATYCNVLLQTNQDGYKPVKAVAGPSGNPYMNWTAITMPLKPGTNVVEAQLMCLAPNAPVTGSPPTVLKHVTHTILAIASASSASSSASASSIPKTSILTK